MSSDLMDEALTGTDGEITASHLLAFRERLQEEVSKWMNEICFPQSARFVKRVRMSSACVGQGRAPRKSPFTLSPQDLVRSFNRIGSLTSKKRGLILTPRLTLNGEEMMLLTWTEDLGFVYQFMISCQVFPEIPALLRWLRSTYWVLDCVKGCARS